MHIAQMSIKQLSVASGWSERAIGYFEMGCTSKGKLIASDVWQRYRLCCASIDHMRRTGWTLFDWGC
jgi:hypothetical protein